MSESREGTARPTAQPTALHARTPRYAPLVTHDGRRAGWSWDRVPRCVGHALEADGHALRTRQPLPLTDGIVRCVHQASRGEPPCNRVQYVALMRLGAGEHEERVWWSVEITDAHLKRMRDEPMIFLQRMTLLACALPGVVLDLARRGVASADESPDASPDERTGTDG